MTRDHHDTLLDQLLREILGGDRPRDLTARVMLRAGAYDRIRRHWWTGTAAALAACLALGITLWALWPANYPGPQLDGEALSNSTELVRGSQIATSDDTATLKLGGYVNVSLDPQTTLTLGGAKFEEKILLEQGAVNVNVTKKKGSFDVVVGPATVHVTGTQFKAGVENRTLEDKGLRVRRLVVTVTEGAVQVQGVGSSPVILAATGNREGTFDLSSEPILLGKPRGIPGLAAGAAAGGRMGGRGAARAIFGGAPRGYIAPNAPIGRGSSTAPANGPLSRLQIIFPNGRLELHGVLRRERDIYFLETDGGNVLLFLQQEPFPNTPAPGKPVNVLWENGKVVRILPNDAR